MDKFIVTASTDKDLIALSLDTRSAYKTAKWDVGKIVRSDAKINCTEWDLFTATYEKKYETVDNNIMDSDVPVGGMVIICDGNKSPKYGFVCGNGNSWYIVPLTAEMSEAVMRFYPPIEWGVRSYSGIRRFHSKSALRNWLMEGLMACEGAEQSHYSDMLCQLEDGAKILEYNR